MRRILIKPTACDCFGNENPIGRHITLSHITFTKGEKTHEVVWVVGDAKYKDLNQPAPPTIYADLIQEGLIGSQLASGRESIRAELRARFVKPKPQC